MKRFFRLLPLLCAILLLGAGTSHALQQSVSGQARPENAVRLTRARVGHQHVAYGTPQAQGTVYDQADLTDDTDEDDETSTAVSHVAAAGFVPSLRYRFGVQALSRPPTYSAREKHLAFGAVPRFVVLGIFRI